jgi:hypothetical protein
MMFLRHAQQQSRIMSQRFSNKAWGCLTALLFLLASLGCVTALRAQPAILFLKNGDRISGVITSENTNRVILTNLWSKEISIPLAEISRREKLILPTAPTNIPPAVAQTKPARPKGDTNQVSATAVTMAAASAPGAKPPDQKNWVADIQLGLDLGFSERNRQNYNGRAKVTYGKDRLRHILDYDFAYGRADGITSANRMDAASKLDYDLTGRWYVYNLINGGYDQIRNINYRFEVGPGMGYHLVKRTNYILNLEAGMDYQAQQLKDGTRPNLFFYRLAENFVWKINPRLTLDEKLEYLPRVEKPNEYKLRFETNMRYALNSNLYLALTVLDLFESRPAAGVSKNDLQVRSSVGVKF